MPTVGEGERAHVVDHLQELRWRVTLVFAVLIAAFAAAWAGSGWLFDTLQRPLNGDYRVQTLGVTEPFFTTVTVCAHVALLVTLPVVIYNLYRYASPALAASQRRQLAPLVALAPLLFAVGVAFSYFFVLGPATRFLLSMGDPSFDVAVRAQEYFSFVSTTLLGSGLVFLFPLVLVGAARLGILRAELLRKNRRVAFVLIAIGAAMLPTGDPVSLVIEILPLVALFELSILLVALQERALRKAREAAHD